VQPVDEASKELFSAILDEIYLIKRDCRILRDTVTAMRYQMDRLTRNFALASENGLFPREVDDERSLDNQGVG